MKSKYTYHSNALAHHFFEQQVLITPEAIAVSSQDQQISYRQLNEYSNQIGNYLQEIGVGPEITVGLCVGRTIDMIAGFLGILKSGGTYVPLDPLYPIDRLHSMASDAQLFAIITQEEFIVKLSGLFAKICRLDRDKSIIMKRSRNNIQPQTTPENLSHIIFTSGSTGVPKGVMMPHKSLCNNLKGFIDAIKLFPNDIYLHTASYAFTSSLRQTLAPLSCGAKIVIANQEQRTNPVALFELIKSEEVTIWDTVAPFWETCLKSIRQKEIPVRDSILKNHLRMILSSGGELPSSLVRAWRRLPNNNTVLYNMYGQTETNGNILIYRIPEEFDTELKKVPLGPPITGTKVYLLDDKRRISLKNNVAQISIGGGCLARGYLNKPDLTAQRFITDLLSNTPGSQIFMSGDLGRSLPDQTISFTGRADFQVNVRGHRIELGEVEAAITHHTHIAEAVASVYESPSGKTELAIYYEAEPNEAPPIIDEIRKFLLEKIPEYMVPSRYIKLKSLPRLPNGKINRHNLPKIQSQENRPELSNAYILPGNPTENIVAGIWQEILGLEKVGILDNFFDLGGNSLLAAQLIDQLGNYFKTEFPLSVMFETPTVQTFCEKIIGNSTALEEAQKSVDRGKIRKKIKRKRKKKQ